MIVATDFVDHWKCELLRTRLADPSAPLLVIRLWANCQLRKSDRIERATPAKLAAICKYAGDPATLWEAMLEAEWLDMDGEDMIAHGWAEMNASLVAAWENGKKGGRPPKPTGNPRVTHGQPTANPSKTQPKPIDLDRENRKTDDTPPTPPRGVGKGGKRTLTAVQKKLAKVAENTPTMVRVGAWFRRKPETLWTVAEAEALAQIDPTEADLDTMEGYYTAEIDRDADYRRRDLQTLLNNWAGELDRAKRREQHVDRGWWPGDARGS